MAGRLAPPRELVGIDPLKKLRDAIAPAPKSADDIAARAEADRVRSEMETIRLSQRSGAGENYQSGRGST